MARILDLYEKALLNNESNNKFPDTVIQVVSNDKEKKIENLILKFPEIETINLVDFIYNNNENSIGDKLYTINYFLSPISKANNYNLEEQDLILKNINDYYLRVSFVDESNIYKTTKKIHMESNFFDVKKIYSFFIESLKKSFNNENDYVKMLKHSKISYNNELIRLSFNEVTLENDFDDSSFIFDTLNVYLEELNSFLYKHNKICYLKTIFLLSDELLKKIHISRICFDELKNIFEENNIKYVSDFVPTDLANLLSEEQVDFLFENLMDIVKRFYSLTSFDICENITEDRFEIINLRYGLLTDSFETLEQIGVAYGVTRERIRQIEKRSLEIILNHPAMKFFIDICPLISRYQHLTSFDSVRKSEYRQYILLATAAGIFEQILNKQLILFNVDAKNSILKLNNLPIKFYKEDLDENINLHLSELHSYFDLDEIKMLINCVYKDYGPILSKIKINTTDVLSYLLPLYFPDGISITKREDLDLLRNKAAELFNGYEFGNDRALGVRICDCCHLSGRGKWTFGKNELLLGPEMIDKISKYIDEYKYPVILIKHLFEVFKRELLECGIENHYHLQGQIKIINSKYKLTRDYLYKYDDISFTDIVEEFVESKHGPVTREMIFEEFPGITDAIISNICQETNVINMNGYFVHLNDFNLSTEEINQLLLKIKSYVIGDKIYHSKDVYYYLKDYFADLFYRINLNDYLQFYYLISKLFENDFSFLRPFIANHGVVIPDGENQVINKIVEIGGCDIAGIKEIAKEVGTIIDRYIVFIDKYNTSIIFKDHNSVIPINLINLNNIDFTDLDGIVSKFIGNEKYKQLSLFNLFYELPQLSISWNKWVLYSIIKKYSKSFAVCTSSNTLMYAEPVVYKKGFDIESVNFGEMIVDDSNHDIDLIDYLDIEDLL